jgi:hypothetical protein
MLQTHQLSDPSLKISRLLAEVVGWNRPTMLCLEDEKNARQVKATLHETSWMLM